jgi:hypothetical protein
LFAVAGLFVLVACLPHNPCDGQDAETVHWAFRPLPRAAVPAFNDFEQGRTPVDAFLLAELRKHDLSFAEEADQTTLARRVYLDLIGLPPTAEAVDAFLADTKPGAYERLVDRLLSSPHFGERWGRHWLDVVGYTDTVGFDIDANLIIIPLGKWRYRHYVIDSLNADKPYDEFVREQVAGDEMVDWKNAEIFTEQIRERLIATGFLRTASDFTHEPESDIPLNHFAVLHDTVEIVGNSLLGLTLQCSRCHDHKFDPVTQREYYQLMACFTPAYNPASWKPVYPWKPEIKHRGLPDISPRELQAAEQHNRDVDAKIAKLNKDREQLLRPTQERLKADKSEKDAKVTDKEIIAALSESDRKRHDDLQRQIAALQSTKKTWGTIQALYDVSSPPETRILEGGSYETPGEPVSAAFHRAISNRDSNDYFEVRFRSGLASGGIPFQPSGRRTALANWLTEPDSPASALLARVIVNRLWQHLFGRGLVPTSDNFGVQGERPSHPELLDWLCGEFTRNDWQLKTLIRLLVTSTTYRQRSSIPQSELRIPHSIDPDNRMLWKMPLRRLDSEVVRDSILFAAGTLDRGMGGPPVWLQTHSDGLVEVDKGRLRYPSEGNRRSIYLVTRRAYNESLLTAFDQPSIATTCSRRSPSAVVSQSLTMLNSKFMFEQAERLAARVLSEAGGDPQDQIKAVFRRILIREPSDDESHFCMNYLREQTGRFRSEQSPDKASRAAITQLCHSLLNTSEFLYAE